MSHDLLANFSLDTHDGSPRNMLFFSEFVRKITHFSSKFSAIYH